MTEQTAQPANYERKDLTDLAQIVRDKQTKTAFLIMDTDEEWSLFSGLSVERIDLSKPLLTGKGKNFFLLDVSKSTRSYFLIEMGTTKAILAEKLLPMEGGFNFRDLGGIRTMDGKYVKWGKLIRSDELHGLTEADLAYLSNLPLISIVDFRSENEVEANADLIPSSVKQHYKFSMNPGNMSSLSDIFGLTSDDIDNLMMGMYVSLVSDPETVALYKKFFALLQNEENLPLLFHCTAGKDRTGMAAALILFALNVEESVIIDDYMQSNIHLDQKYSQYITTFPLMKSIFQVKAKFLQAGIEKIRTDYGSVDNYLETVLGVDLAEFRNLYLY